MLGVLSLSLLLLEIDSTILNVALPTLQREFNATGASVQWLVDSYLLVFAGLLLFMGGLADRFGRKRALQAGLGLFALSSIAAANVDSIGQLIAARVAMGIGAALIMPATLAIIAHVFPRDEQLKAVSLWGAAAVLGVPSGPILGGWLLSRFDWGSVFYVAAPVALVAILAGMPLVPESKNENPAPLDKLGALLSIGVLGSLVYAIIKAPDGLLAAEVSGPFVASLAFALAFSLHELRTPEPLLDVRLFKDHALTTSYAAITITFGALVGTIFLLTQYFQFALGDSPLLAGVRIVPVAVGFASGAAFADNLVKRFGVRTVMTTGLVLVAFVFAALSQAIGDPPYAVLAIGLFGITFSMAFVLTPATAAVMGAVPGGSVGVGSALNDTARQVGAALGVAVLGSLTKDLYASNLTVPASLPAPLVVPVRDSIGRAAFVASGLDGSAGDALRSAAASAFSDAFGVAMIAVAVAAAFTAALVWHLMPGPVIDETAAVLDPALASVAEDESEGGSLVRNDDAASKPASMW
jgi:EmrB/QacA subfamily drug resistance transporter